MKAFRSSKKKKLIMIQDPQKIAQDKLVIFSQQAFIKDEDSLIQQDTWTLNSLIQSQTKFLTNKQRKQISSQISLKQKIPKSTQLFSSSKISNHYNKQFQQSRSKSNQLIDIFHQRKSLSLTSYVLLDQRAHQFQKRRKAIDLQEKNKLKLRYLKRRLTNQKYRKNMTSYEKFSFIQSKDQDRKNVLMNLKTQILTARTDNALLSVQKANGSKIQTRPYTKFQNQVKLSTQNISKEKIKLLQPAINSSKALIHSYYKRFTY